MSVFRIMSECQSSRQYSIKVCPFLYCFVLLLLSFSPSVFVVGAVVLLLFYNGFGFDPTCDVIIMVHHDLLGLHVISVLHAMSNQGLAICLTCDVSIARDVQ